MLQDLVLKFYSSVVNGLKLNVKKVVRASLEELTGDTFIIRGGGPFRPRPILQHVKASMKNLFKYKHFVGG